ncbi:MAG: superoxide dismutase [Fe] [Nitrospirae bacterium]|nr:superoxide dismutase [Fe] [Nitrospirota bacterium]
MEHKLPRFIYANYTFVYYITDVTIEYLHVKPHNTYVINLAKLIIVTAFVNFLLVDIIKKASIWVFNNSVQAWNHIFYWKCQSSNGGGESLGKIADEIKNSLNLFIEKFNNLAITTFGTGWAWLVKDINGSSLIQNTTNAENPLIQNKTPLLTNDIYDHAYYIK